MIFWQDLTWMIALSVASSTLSQGYTNYNHDVEQTKTDYKEMNSNITLALLQMPQTMSSSLSSIETFLSEAASNGSNIAIFPSSFLQGSCQTQWLNQTISWSKKYKMAICVTCNMSVDNSSEAMLVDENGNLLLFYSKSGKRYQTNTDQDDNRIILQQS